MTEIMRLRVAWTGAPVTGPGVSTLYADSTGIANWPAAVLTLFNTVKNSVPNGVTFDVPNVADVINVQTGRLTGTYTFTGGGTVTSAGGTTDYKPGTGLRMRWGTNGVVGGRRVSGTTFVCPVAGQELPNGVVLSATRTSIVTAMNAYIATSGFVPVVYSPPVDNDPDPNNRNRDGAFSEILSASVPAAMTWLRSRRT